MTGFGTKRTLAAPLPHVRFRGKGRHRPCGDAARYFGQRKPHDSSSRFALGPVIVGLTFTAQKARTINRIDHKRYGIGGEQDSQPYGKWLIANEVASVILVARVLIANLQSSPPLARMGDTEKTPA